MPKGQLRLIKYLSGTVRPRKELLFPTAVYPLSLLPHLLFLLRLCVSRWPANKPVPSNTVIVFRQKAFLYRSLSWREHSNLSKERLHYMGGWIYATYISSITSLRYNCINMLQAQKTTVITIRDKHYYKVK